MLFRRVYAHDLQDIHQLALNAGVGLTTLPHDETLLSTRIAHACASFDKAVTKPQDEYYLFVLEDSQTGKLVGTSAIQASTNTALPFYAYKLSQHRHRCPSLGIHNDYTLLNLINDWYGNTELCTLFLNADSRHHGNGLLLSRARFLFIKTFATRFQAKIIAEMRGVSDEKGCSPFWDHVIAPFFNMSFSEADSLSLSTNKQFIADLMPQHPLYLQLLHPHAQAVVAKAHPNSEAALHILLHEGFVTSPYVDIFDAGPIIEAQIPQIKSIQQSLILTIRDVCEEVSGPRFIAANRSIDFRATLAKVLIDDAQTTCVISKDVAAILQLKLGDKLCVSPLNLS